MTRICLVPYGESWTHPGGHKTQQLQTAVALRRAGAHVLIANPGFAGAHPFDIVNVFGEPTELTPFGHSRGRLVLGQVDFCYTSQTILLALRTDNHQPGLEPTSAKGRSPSEFPAAPQ